ncbi:SDR family NAD(P)-dependent oxidoreductase [Curtobacterium flaccumfaciens pv. beticola]|uniref:SDR family NAD(P)-dependent oxidoreductase n=1 Tax=Curtobacterium flaccumfaciens TaxID=2035 RepID=UPI00349F5C65|nr:SDR family NAD(P)-dependent oxidoreductase [Curtobacterium flaccumfaciens pv. basellae]
MNSIAIFGAGQGLGRALAQRYAQDGYEIVLVARRREPLDAIAAELHNEHGASVQVVTGDLSSLADIAQIAASIREAVGVPDVLYFGPTPSGGGFVAAADLDDMTAASWVQLLFINFVALVQEFLPAMRSRGTGAIVTVQGTTALGAPAGMSGPGPAAAAQRNYLDTLSAELDSSNIHVGRHYVGSLILGSAAADSLEQARLAGADLPDFPTVSPDDLADKIAQAQAAGTSVVTITPEEHTH